MTRRPAMLASARLALIATLALGSFAQGALAQSVAVLRVDPAAEPLCQALEQALSGFQLSADPGYFAEAQRRGLDPSSDEALAQLTPALQVQIAVVPLSADAQAVQIEFRDGASGASLGSAAIPLQNGGLGWQGRRALELEIRRRLAQADGAAPVEASPENEDDDEDEDAAEAEGAAAAESEEAFYFSVFGGAGMGTRDLSWPAAGETLSVETGAFLAVEVGASFGLRLGSSTQLGPELAYQTSLDHEMEETHVSGASDTMGIRAHRFEALLALTFRLGASGGFRIAPALGYALRNLRPDVHHLRTPGYTLAGPLLRVTLRIPFGDSVALRLSPEAQYALVGDDLEERGVESSGLSFGGQAGIEIALSAQYNLELTFREAHALLPSTEGGDAADVERFATARLVWQP